jgi:hypothetical protein
MEGPGPKKKIEKKQITAKISNKATVSKAKAPKIVKKVEDPVI